MRLECGKATITSKPDTKTAACGSCFPSVRIGSSARPAANASRSPPFAPAYAHYTHRLEAFVNDLRGLMTVSDLAAVTGLSWDTVKHIVKHALEKDCGHPRLKDLRYLAEATTGQDIDVARARHS